MVKNFIDIRDFTKIELLAMLRLAKEIKEQRSVGMPLRDLSFGLLFGSASTRTRISFQLAIRQLGGHADYFRMQDLQLSNFETLADTAQVLGRYLDGLVVRNYDMDRYGAGRASLLELASNSGLPLINALDDMDHPCQAMADILTLREKFGDQLEEKKLVVTWAYADRQKSPGVPQSLLSLATLLGLKLTIAHPIDFDLDPEYVAFARNHSNAFGAAIEFTNDLDDACEGADVVYAKSWKSLGLPSDRDIELRTKVRSKWMVEQRHLDMANDGAYFMNCMPLIRGQQASAEVVDGERSLIYEQAENRLHVQKAILSELFGGMLDG